MVCSSTLEFFLAHLNLYKKKWFLAFFCGGTSVLIHHKLGKTNFRFNQKHITLGPVVRRPISDNPGLNFNAGFFSFLLHFLG